MYIFTHNLLPKSSYINVSNMFALWDGVIIIFMLITQGKYLIAY